MKVACAMIIFCPDEKVPQRLAPFQSFPGKVYVMDDSQDQNVVSRLISSLPYISYFHEGINRGIAWQLNQACQQAISEGFDWLLTMDQDSFLTEAGQNTYLDCIDKYPEKEKIAMFGIGYDGPLGEAGGCSATIAEELITSGSMINLSLYNSIGPFDNSLFIDYVDTDYCLRARNSGALIVQFDHLTMRHAIGETHTHRSLKTLQLSGRSLHTPLRLYYMVSNYLYIRKKYKQSFPAEIERHRKALVNRMKNNLLYGRQRLQVARYILKGYFDYRNGTFNKIN